MTRGVRKGERIDDRFEVIECVGEGAFSIVFKARDIYLDEFVAIKLFRDQIEPDIPWREASSLGLLRAPGVVKLIEEGRHEGCEFLVLEYVDGTPFPGASGPCSWSSLVPLIERLLETLTQVHQQGIIHRDIKPGNVLVTQRGDVKLLDFNLSYNHSLQWQTTQHAAFYGTLSYVAPEQIRNGPTTVRTDLYAVGVMLFEALTGELPFQGESYQQQIRSILMSKPPDLMSLCPDLAPEIGALVTQLISREPEARPESARAVIKAIQCEGTEYIEPGLQAWLTAMRRVRRGSSSEVMSTRDLLSLFRGPERIFHLRSQPAKILHACTQGRVDAMHMELARWVRLGLATWQDGELVVTAESVAHLQAGFGREDISVEGERLNEASHRQLAMSMRLDDPMRLFHWSRAGEREIFLNETLATARALDQRGAIVLAIACLREGLRVANKAPKLHRSCRVLLIQWAKIALSTSSPREIERVLHALTRTIEICEEDEFVSLAEFLRRARRASMKFGKKHVDALDELDPFDDDELELRRAMYQIRALWSQPLGEAEAKLEEIAVWARQSPLSEVKACLLGWRGILLVRQARFQEAAAFHARAARLHPRRSAVIAAMLNSASAHIDGLNYEAAIPIAEEARDLARSCHHHVNEAMALYLIRAARYRSLQELSLDPDLIQATSQLDAPSIEGLLNLLEAAIAWRSGQPGREFANRARHIWLQTGNQWGEMLAAALELLTSEKTAEASIVMEIVVQVKKCPMPRVALQVVGLLLLGAPHQREHILSSIDPVTLAEQVPREQWSSRLEVISLDEALSAL